MTDPALGDALTLFFLACVIAAGLFGAATSARQVLFVQTIPAAIARALTFTSAQSRSIDVQQTTLAEPRRPACACTATAVREEPQ